ncbi:hypothetical protein Tsp_05170 [Trichinella spiralis]|uniref:hypothetical protein n=1 Tax=Trichinella spiralis TaxID=6334 RepID=UPI0001EFD3D5|nr:hypothetical protein Tsp_05170 [Trichinella spiralis]
MSAAFQAHRCRGMMLKAISFSVVRIISTLWLPLCIFEFHRNFKITIRRSYHITTGSEIIFYRRLHRLRQLFKALKQTTETEALFGTPYSSAPILAITNKVKTAINNNSNMCSITHTYTHCCGRMLQRKACLKTKTVHMNMQFHQIKVNRIQKQLYLKIYSSTSFIQRNPHIGQITNGDAGEVNI